MNPATFIILAWEKKLEIQRQDQWLQEHNTDKFLLEKPKPGQKNSWISRFYKRRSQTGCECSQAA